MSLAAGTKLGPYEIVEPIGKGGMGEVYRAHDSRLGRDVAIKVSAEQFTERFEREARAVAALNHPNICHLYDVGPNYLVMELIEGESPKGPLPLEEALRIARQIADALEAAHEKGIVHRDLKPANIKIKPDGTVKVLDFGLATLGAAAGTDPAESPTMLSTPTQAGMILGTAAYMSPEQARGKQVDKRADIWAFGVVLYELLSGDRPFHGDDIAEVLASVMKDQPDLSKAPPELRRLLRKCLEKDPRKRLRDMGDAWELLDETPVARVTAGVLGRRANIGWIAAGAFALIAIAAAALGFLQFRQRPATVPSVVRFQIPVPDEAGAIRPAISPDGKQVVYPGGNRLWVRAIDSLNPKPLAGTEGTLNSQLFWSADSRFVIFGAAGKLQKVAVSGGPPQVLCDLPGFLLGGFETRDGRIVFSSTDGLLQVGSGGGAASELHITGLTADARFNFAGGSPLLPDGRHFVFQNVEIYVGSLDGRENAKRLLPDQSPVEYVPSQVADSGYLLFRRGGTLLAQPFNPKRLDIFGDPVPLAQQITTFSASPSGALVYRVGGGERKLVWFDRQGKSLETAWSGGDFGELALSPDRSRVAAVRVAAGSATVWIHEFTTQTSTRLVFGGTGVKPVWSPDASRIVFASTREGGHYNLYEKLSNGAGTEEPLLKSDLSEFPEDWSPDGRWLLYAVADPKTKGDLWLLPMRGNHKPEPFLVTDYRESDGQFSPDGRFIAYVSDESGKFEVYVRSFPAAGGGKWVVSSGGGYQPRWRRDGKELFYFSDDGKLMSVDVTAGPGFKASAPKVLFQAPIFGGGATTNNHYWDVAADGKRFLINTVGGESTATPLTVVLNWEAGLKR